LQIRSLLVGSFACLHRVSDPYSKVRRETPGFCRYVKALHRQNWNRRMSQDPFRNTAADQGAPKPTP